MPTWIFRLGAIIVLLGLTLSQVQPSAPVAAAPLMQSLKPNGRVILHADSNESSLRVLANPPSLTRQAQTATFIINYLPAGSVDDPSDPSAATCATWPAAAQTAFAYATTLWGSYLTSTVPIRIDACWSNLGSSSILGYSWSDTFYRDFSGAPQSNTWYAVALANALRGSDLNGSSTAEIHITYNSNFNWYFGTSGTPGSGQMDFVTVVMHEITHGLNFAGWMTYGSTYCGGATYGCWGYSTGFPSIYDRFMENGTGQLLISAFSNNSAALGSQLTSSNLYFDGTNARAANSGSPPKMYAPYSWSGGSSYSHVDTIYDGTANALMTWSVASQEVVHQPGPIVLGILKDLGWTTGATCYTLTTNVLPAGAGSVVVNTSPNCETTKYTAGTNVTLTASPNSGYQFYMWSGITSGVNPTTFAISGNTSATAHFTTPDTKWSFLPMIRK